MFNVLFSCSDWSDAARKNMFLKKVGFTSSCIIKYFLFLSQLVNLALHAQVDNSSQISIVKSDLAGGD